MGMIASAGRINRATIGPVLRGTLRWKGKVRSPEDHLLAAVDWLRTAQDRCGDGVTGWYGYFIREGRPGWSDAYPETTGYIIPTLLDTAEQSDAPDLPERAVRMGEWLLTLQLPEGGFPGGLKSEVPAPTVFNTGQILKGLHRLWIETSDVRYRQACDRAAKWLADAMSEDGAFRKHLSPFVPTQTQHTYNVRVAWIMLSYARQIDDQRIFEAASANMRFALSMQRSNGWFAENGMKFNDAPCLHETAYSTRGLIECGILAGDEEAVRGAMRAADALLARQRNDGGLGGDFFREDWTPLYGATCLTGLCQMSINWMILFEHTGERRYLEGASRALRFVCSTQNLNSVHSGVRGGIAGSFPVWGKYMAWTYPNWTAKFLIDGLLRIVRLGGWQK